MKALTKGKVMESATQDQEGMAECESETHFAELNFL